MRQLLARPSLRRIYYGWVMLLAVSLGQVVSWGILYYSFPVFVIPMAAELGWDTSTMTAGFALALLCSGLAAVPVGRWLDRHGTRVLMTAGSCAAVLLLLAWANVHEMGVFSLILAAIGTVMAAVLYEPAFAIVATWFREQRGRALTLLTFFGAWASVIFIPLSAWLVELYGWRQALLVLAGILAVTTIPHTRCCCVAAQVTWDCCPTARRCSPATQPQPLPLSAASPRVSHSARRISGG